MIKADFPMSGPMRLVSINASPGSPVRAEANAAQIFSFYRQGEGTK
jgi:hypothetical protein